MQYSAIQHSRGEQISRGGNRASVSEYQKLDNTYCKLLHYLNNGNIFKYSTLLIEHHIFIIFHCINK